MSVNCVNCIFGYAIPIRWVDLKIPISVLVLIHNRNREVLLLERADRPGFWQSVTGSLDLIDEPFESAAIREVAEETGIDVHALPLGSLQNLHHAVQYEIYPGWRHRYPPGVERNTEHWFALEVPADASIRLAPREHLQYVWLPYQEAAQKCFSHTNRDAILKFYNDPSELT
jgi:dATP pyrophosphohydrolase